MTQWCPICHVWQCPICRAMHDTWNDCLRCQCWRSMQAHHEARQAQTKASDPLDDLLPGVTRDRALAREKGYDS